MNDLNQNHEMLASVIRAELAERDLTTEEFAQMAGVDNLIVERILAGKGTSTDKFFKVMQTVAPHNRRALLEAFITDGFVIPEGDLSEEIEKFCTRLEGIRGVSSTPLEVFLKEIAHNAPVTQASGSLPERTKQAHMLARVALLTMEYESDARTALLNSFIHSLEIGLNSRKEA